MPFLFIKMFSRSIAPSENSNYYLQKGCVILNSDYVENNLLYFVLLLFTSIACNMRYITVWSKNFYKHQQSWRTLLIPLTRLKSSSKPVRNLHLCIIVDLIILWIMNIMNFVKLYMNSFISNFWIAILKIILRKFVMWDFKEILNRLIESNCMYLLKN